MYIETKSPYGVLNFEMCEVGDAIQHCIGYINSFERQQCGVSLAILSEEDKEICSSGIWVKSRGAIDFVSRVASMLVIAYEGDE